MCALFWGLFMKIFLSFSSLIPLAFNHHRTIESRFAFPFPFALLGLSDELWPAQCCRTLLSSFLWDKLKAAPGFLLHTSPVGNKCPCQGRVEMSALQAKPGLCRTWQLWFVSEQDSTETKDSFKNNGMDVAGRTSSALISWGRQSRSEEWNRPGTRNQILGLHSLHTWNFPQSPLSSLCKLKI